MVINRLQCSSNAQYPHSHRSLTAHTRFSSSKAHALHPNRFLPFDQQPRNYEHASQQRTHRHPIQPWTSWTAYRATLSPLQNLQRQCYIFANLQLKNTALAFQTPLPPRRSNAFLLFASFFLQLQSHITPPPRMMNPELETKRLLFHSLGPADLLPHPSLFEICAGRARTCLPLLHLQQRHGLMSV